MASQGTDLTAVEERIQDSADPIVMRATTILTMKIIRQSTRTAHRSLASIPEAHHPMGIGMMNTRLENRAPVTLEVPLDLLARPDLAIFLGTRLKNPHTPSTAHHEDSGEDSETRIFTKDEICGMPSLVGIRESLTRPPVAKGLTHT